MHSYRVAGCIAAALVAGAVVGAQSGSVPRLPTPSGSFGVGRMSFHWVDRQRPDPFSSDVAARRELMVYVWYPAPPDQKTDDGIYQPFARQIDAAPDAGPLRQSPMWKSIVSGEVTSHARDQATAAARPRTFPIVLFSHGDSSANSFSYTSAIEDWVSHGYVVAAIEHPYSSMAVAFPDGRVILGNRPRLRGDRPAGKPYFDGVEVAMKDMRQMGEIDAADVRFVLNQLDDLNRSDRLSPLFRRLDLQRIAVVGHSLGGMVAIRACQHDVRITACVNQDGDTPDGLFLRYGDAKPLQQPFLYVDASPTPTYTDQQLTERGITRAEWDRNARAVTGMQRQQLQEDLGGSYRVQLRAPGMNHGSFGDAVLAAATDDARRTALHNTALTTDVTRAFLDKTLKGDRHTLLDRANVNPEVTIEAFPPHR